MDAGYSASDRRFAALVEALERAHAAAVASAEALQTARDLAVEVAHEDDVERLEALWLVMRADTPALVPDHVPAEWSGGGDALAGGTR